MKSWQFPREVVNPSPVGGASLQPTAGRARRRLSARHGLLLLAAVAWMPMACEVSVTLPLPRTASNEETRGVDLPAGARVVIDNDVGSVRVAVDPVATVALIEIRRLAAAETKEAAEALLEKIVVTVTEPTDEDNTLRISAPKPAEASGASGQFEVEYNDASESVQIIQITANIAVASVELRITLPPGHEVEVDQGIGHVRAIALDATASLMTDRGSIRSRLGKAALTVRANRGDISVESHAASLDARSQRGEIALSLGQPPADGQVIVRAQDGAIEARLPENIDAQLTALTEDGSVIFRARDFDNVSNLAQGDDSLEATLNDGGTVIDLRTEDGSVRIRSF